MIMLWHGLLLGLILQVEELTDDELGHLVRVRVRVEVRVASALYLSRGAPQVSSTPPYLEAIAIGEFGHLGGDRRAQVHDAVAEEQRRHVRWRADPHPIDHDAATCTRRLHRHATGTHLP